MKILSLTTFFIVYVIVLSFIPLVHQMFVAQNSWLGYGTGAYAFQSPNYFVLFNDPYDGSSKPNIHINPNYAPNVRISLVEFSDWTSYVNGFNLFNDFNATIRTKQNLLDTTYAGHGLVIHKTVEVTGDQVVVRLEANKEFNAHIEMWKWLMTSINNASIKDTPKPKLMTITRTINFTYKDQSLGTLGGGTITLSRTPTQIEAWPFATGFNRVTVDFINSEMTFTISGTVAGQQKFPAWTYTELPYALPIIAIIVCSLYLMADHYGWKKSKDHTRSSRR